MNWIFGARMAFIGIVAVAGHAIMLASPGLFSHDELQRWEELQRHELGSSLLGFFTNPPDVLIGYRPVADVVWSFSLLLYPSHLKLLHLTDLIPHVLSSILVYLLAGLYTRRPASSLVAALVFALSPLTTLAAGWSGAVFDRVFVFFALVALYAAARFIGVSGQSARTRATLLVVVAIASGAAYFSKETALVLPAVVVLACLPQLGRWRSLAMVALASAIPLPVYLIVRLRPILDTLAGQTAGPYGLHLAEVPGKVLAYFAFPFAAGLSDAVNMPLLVPQVWVVLCAIHLGLILVLAITTGVRGALWYAGLYYLFLLPVILLAPLETHALYGSGVAVALAAALLVDNVQDRRFLAVLAAVGVLLAWHNVTIQSRVYQAGACQAQVFGALRSFLTQIDEDGAVPITIDASASAMKDNIAAALAYTSRVGPFDRLKFRFAPIADGPTGLQLTADAGCGLVAQNLSAVKRPPDDSGATIPSPEARPGNLLRNAAFEPGREPGIAAEWEAPFRQDVGLRVLTGSGSTASIQRIRLAYASDPVARFGSIQQRLKADPEGGTYTLSVDYRYEFDSAVDASRSVGMVVFPLDKNGKVITQSRAINFGWTPTSSWTRKSMTFSMPPGTADLLVEFRISVNGTFWVANPDLRRGATVELRSRRPLHSGAELQWL